MENDISSLLSWKDWGGIEFGQQNSLIIPQGPELRFSFQIHPQVELKTRIHFGSGTYSQHVYPLDPGPFQAGFPWLYERQFDFFSGQEEVHLFLDRKQRFFAISGLQLNYLQWGQANLVIGPDRFTSPGRMDQWSLVKFFGFGLRWNAGLKK